jgi:hypothetical protein
VLTKIDITIKLKSIRGITNALVDEIDGYMQQWIHRFAVIYSPKIDITATPPFDKITICLNQEIMPA